LSAGVGTRQQISSIVRWRSSACLPSPAPPALHQVGRGEVFDRAHRAARSSGHRAPFTFERVGNGAQRGGLPAPLPPRMATILPLGYLQGHALEHRMTWL
jgi:hypothetical protein